MIIINFISGRDMGGPKQSFILYAKLFKKLNYDCINIVRSGAKLENALKNEGLNVKGISYFRTLKEPFKTFSIKKIKKIFIPINADIIFIHKQIDIELVREALGDKAKIIGVIHGFNAKNIEGADALIAVSNSVKEFLIKKGFKKPIYVVPNMIQNNTIPKEKEFSKPIVLGAMGIFRRKKGFHTLLKALYILKNRGINFKMKIAGKGQLFLYLQYLRLKYNLINEVEFVGWIESDKREEFFDSLDVFVLPSRTESFGMVVVEAMGRKKIVVATNCEGPSEIIKNGINGFLVEKQNPNAMADMLEKIILNKIDLNNITSNAYKNAIENYEVQSLMNRLNDIIKDVLYNQNPL